MNDDISNRVLLEHMQAMKIELKQDISRLSNRVGSVERRSEGLSSRMDNLHSRLDHLEQRMERGFADAKAHREALQEDLEATILLQGKHEKRLTKLERK